MDSHPEKIVHWVRRTQTNLDLKSQFRPSSKLTTWEVQPCLHTSYNKTLHLCKIICAEALASGGLCRGSPDPYCRRLGPRSLLGASSWTQWGRALRLMHLQSQKQKSAPMSTTQSKYKTLYTLRGAVKWYRYIHASRETFLLHCRTKFSLSEKTYAAK